MSVIAVVTDYILTTDITSNTRNTWGLIFLQNKRNPNNKTPGLRFSLNPSHGETVRGGSSGPSCPPEPMDEPSVTL